MHLPLIQQHPRWPAAAGPALTDNQRLALGGSRRLARLMDAQWGFGPLRFGLETLVDFIPGVGDAVSIGVSLYQLAVARQLGVPRGRRFQMGVNMGIDALVGALPVLGDAADTMFKAHVRNQRIIDDYLALGEGGRRAA